MPNEKIFADGNRLKNRKSFILFFLIPLLVCLLSAIANAGNKTEALELLQNLVNNPSKAKEMRSKIKNASKTELTQYDEFQIIIEKEINTISSSLPRRIDKYTTMDTASISGKNVAFKYTLSNDMAGIEHKNEIMSEMEKMLKNGFCSSPSGAWLILGYTWSYFYYRENGTYYGGVIIDAKACDFE